MNDERRNELEQEIRNLRSQLTSDVSEIGDWKVIKYQEYVDAGKPAPYDINELNAQRQAVRDRINEIQRQLDE